ncbi:DUF1064 domain-containing protein [Candidatus Dojkabacteria bacterium]|jgi:hypothetical protein|nr:DUF1064 domain-containing protein [Candidatus Dojkabacteria bacterium]
MYYQKKKWTTAQKATYKDNLYDSKFEASYAADLDLLVRAKKVKSWERQVKIPLEINGFHICNYYIDFIVYHTDGTIEYTEAKGWPSPIWKLKWKMFEALYSEKPDVKLTVVQQGNFKMPHAKKNKQIKGIAKLKK